VPKSVPKVVPKKSSEIEKWGKIRGMVLNESMQDTEIKNNLSYMVLKQGLCIKL